MSFGSLWSHYRYSVSVKLVPNRFRPIGVRVSAENVLLSGSLVVFIRVSTVLELFSFENGKENYGNEMFPLDENP